MAVTWKKLGFDTDISVADSKAESAMVVVNAVSSAASEGGAVDDTARTMAESASTRASTAQTTAGSAATAASVASSAASLADTKAVSAATAASVASSAASLADTKAESASTRASTATTLANSAATLAGTHSLRHQTSTASSGQDPILLNQLGLPTAVVDFGHQEGTNLVIHTTATTITLSSLSTSLVIGQMAYISSLSGLYVCTVAA